jgi:hypothetical protein
VGEDGQADEDREVRSPQLAQRGGRRPSGHEAQPGQSQPGREVQQRCQCGREAGGRARDQAPDHDEPRRRSGQEVGGQGHEGHAAEHGHQQRGHGDLGGQGHRGGFAEARRTGQSGLEATGQAHDPGGRRHGEGEAHRVDQDRVHQHQGGHGEGQHPGPRDLPTPEGGAGGDRGHRRGPQDRRLEAGQQGEEGEDQEHGAEPRTEREPAQPHAGHDEHEGHILARHGEEVAEPGRPEVVGGGRGLGPVVAEQDPGEQRGGVVPQRLGSSDHGPTQTVGQSADRSGAADRAEVVDQQAAGHMPHGEVGSTRHRDDPPREDRLLPRQGCGEDIGLRPVVHLGLQSAAVEPDDRGHRAAVHLGVGHQGDRPSAHGLGPGRIEPGPRRVRQSGGQEQAPHGEHGRLACRQGQDDDEGAKETGHGRGPPCPEGDDEGDHDRRPVRHRSLLAAVIADAGRPRTASVR